ncbi:hypothetical protein C8R43DRAFT_1126331 [Mycena crocata]|nr:hypothetical protein C8R43DRAFT_1126331 [Mycena crocata]
MSAPPPLNLTAVVLESLAYDALSALAHLLRQKSILTRWSLRHEGSIAARYRGRDALLDLRRRIRLAELDYMVRLTALRGFPDTDGREIRFATWEQLLPTQR